MQARELLRPAARLKNLTVGPGRRRLPLTTSVASFFEALNSAGCRYIVLRWFEDLPDVGAGEDIDLLVSDEHATTLDRHLTRIPIMGRIPVDVYSVSGLPEFSHRGIAYYPPQIASDLIAGAIRHPSGASVPNESDHFKSLAYHALYHKGYKSGLPIDDAKGPAIANPEHNYADVLRTLSERLGITIGISMKELDQYLKKNGWRPPVDALSKLSKRNKWCREIVEEELSSIRAPKGLCVFVVRDAAGGQLSKIKDFIREHDFDIVTTKVLDQDSKKLAESSLRGGNWGCGPYRRSGGAPSTLIAAIDPKPEHPSLELAEGHPEADNARVFKLKYKIRSWWNKEHSGGEPCNPIHTSDSARHAMHYMHLTMPDEARRLEHNE